MEGDFVGKAQKRIVTLAFAEEYRHTENLTMTHSTCIMGKSSSGSVPSSAAQCF
jgi:hypothetical protein